MLLAQEGERESQSHAKRSSGRANFHFFIRSHPLKRANIAHIKSNEILIIVKKLILSCVDEGELS